MLDALTAFLTALPNGLESYPEHVTKGSVVRGFAAHPAMATALDALPQALAALVRDPPSSSAWVRETHQSALVVALSDLLGQASTLEFVKRSVKDTLASPLYRALFVLVGPRRVVTGAGMTFGQFHRGMSVDVRAASDGAELRLRTPQGLVPPFLAECYGVSFVAALELAGAKSVSHRVARCDATEVDYQLKWR
jgi:uncharacterized protein (TIGR02265 family)